MTNIPAPHTYRSPLIPCLTNALWAFLGLLIAHWLYFGSGGGLSAHTSILNLVGSIAMLLAGLYFLYQAIPYLIRFDPAAKTYEYRWGLGPLSRRMSGGYANLDSVVVNQSTSHASPNYRTGSPGAWRTTDTVDVIWANEHRRVSLATAGDVEQAKLAAEEIAAATGLPYGGTYDYWNKMWIEGPFHKQIAPKEHETESQVADEVAATVAREQHSAPSAFPPTHVVPSQHPAAPEPAAHPDIAHPPAGLTDAPPALGDDAGLNESDMWK